MSSSLTTRLCVETHQVTKLYEAHGLEAPMTMCRKYMATYMDIQSRHSKDPVVWYPPSAVLVVHVPLYRCHVTTTRVLCPWPDARE